MSFSNLTPGEDTEIYRTLNVFLIRQMKDKNQGNKTLKAPKLWAQSQIWAQPT